VDKSGVQIASQTGAQTGECAIAGRDPLGYDAPPPAKSRAHPRHHWCLSTNIRQLDEAASPWDRWVAQTGRGLAVSRFWCDTLGFPAVVARIPWPRYRKGYHDVQTQKAYGPGEMQLARLVEGTRREYLRAVHQLAAYYMALPDQLTERKVEDYLLYVRDELGVAKGTFAPIFAGLKFFYLNTLGYDWPLFTKKKSASHAASGCPTSAVMRTAAA